MTDEIMSVEEARLFMPATTAGKSDEEVKQLIINLEVLANSVIEAVRFDDNFRVNIEYNRGKKAE